MDKKLKISLVLFLFSFVFVSFTLLLDKKNRLAETAKPAAATSSLTLFVGDGCPHCEEVEKYLADNKIAAKVPYSQKEIYNNEQNRNELLQVVKNCGLDESTVGIPFLKNGSECIEGTEQIINFFKAKANEK